MSRIRAFSRVDQHLRLDAVAAKNRDRHALRLFEDRGKQIGRFDGLPARLGWHGAAPA